MSTRPVPRGYIFRDCRPGRPENLRKTDRPSTDRPTRRAVRTVGPWPLAAIHHKPSPGAGLPSRPRILIQCKCKFTLAFLKNTNHILVSFSPARSTGLLVGSCSAARAKPTRETRMLVFLAARTKKGQVLCPIADDGSRQKNRQQIAVLLGPRKSQE